MLTGIVCGLAIMVKVVAAFFIFIPMAVMLLASRRTLRILREPQFWVMLSAIFIVSVPYYLLGSSIGEGEFFGIWPIFEPEFLTNFDFYLDWQAFALPLVEYAALFLAVVGTFGYVGMSRGLMVGLWLGYIDNGITFPNHITSHSYYSLPLIIIVALGIAWPCGEVVKSLAKLKQSRVWLAFGIITLLLLLMVPVRHARGVLAAYDYRPRKAYLEHIGALLEHRSSVLLVTRDYGFPIVYYGWIAGSYWAEFPSLEAECKTSNGISRDCEIAIRERLAGHSDLVITELKDLERGPSIKQFLYASYAVKAEGEGFVIFDLQ
ncbi:MAG: hypothetical protein GTO18_10965 [Anaerolineales bacterium]|nr:hypothetical protein [Anaerolineales bacterium]